MPNTFTSLHYHLVFATKDRQPLIAPDLQERLFRYIGGVITHHNGVVIEIGGMPDHIHILLGLPASLSIAQAAKAIKGSSSRWLNQTFDVAFRWQTGYAAFSVSNSQMAFVSRYIQNQEEHHRMRPFQDELDQLLKHHNCS